jgi:hypothetical protein
MSLWNEALAQAWLPVTPVAWYRFNEIAIGMEEVVSPETQEKL